MILLQTYRDSFRKYYSFFMLGVLVFLSLISALPFLFITYFIFIHGFKGLSWEFFTQIPLPPGEKGGGGMGNAIVGSASIVGLASLIGIPWGIAVGIYLSEYSHKKLNSYVRFVVDLMTTIPSIVIGIFVYHLVVVYFGFSAYAGALALSLIMLPIIAKSTEEILKLIPFHIREAGLALGLPRWKVIMRILLPGSFSMILSGVILAIARIAGETAPLLFTSLGNQFYARGLNEPTSTLPVQIYEFSKSGFENLENLAWTGSLVLILFVVFINLIFRFTIYLLRKKMDNG